MQILTNQSLAKYTSLGVGGNAEKLIIAENYNDILSTLESQDFVIGEDLWVLGFGSNSLISDKGLPGTTVLYRGGKIERNGSKIVVDGGVWWDDLVKYSVQNELWGLELTTEIPGNVSGAIHGNIAAYGQQVSDTLNSVEVYDLQQKITLTLKKDDISFSYRASSLQQNPHYIILRATFDLSSSPLHELRYNSALVVAEELAKDPNNLQDRRVIITETRRRAGSIFHPDDPTSEHTAGSFFKNPLVTKDQAINLAKYDETGKTLERIQEQSKIHGGDAQRASAAHVLLAAGFNRGQTWGAVRLHPSHVLKLENTGGAKAQDIKNVADLITSTVKEKLEIKLESEVKQLGQFD
jgi:UDP-N-acetylmuramate dehydrogenase